jgi:hypothetical protein
MQDSGETDQVGSGDKACQLCSGGDWFHSLLRVNFP